MIWSLKRVKNKKPESPQTFRQNGKILSGDANGHSKAKTTTREAIALQHTRFSFRKIVYSIQTERVLVKCFLTFPKSAEKNGKYIVSQRRI